MPPTINKALFRIVGATTSPSSDRGYNALALETLTFSLEDSTGVLSVAWQLYDPNDPDSPLASLNAPAMNFVESGTPFYSTLVASTTASAIIPADASPVSNSWLLRCTVGSADGNQSFTRAINRIGTKTRKPVPGETAENGLRGWADAIALLIENGVSSPGAPGVGLIGAADLVIVANDPLSGTAVRNGVTPTVGMRALATAQTTASQNGMWVVASGAWTRPTDYSSDAQVAAALGTPIYIKTGSTVGGNSFWYQQTGTTLAGSKTFTQLGGAGLQVFGTPADQWLVTWSAANTRAEWQPTGGLQVLSFNAAVGLYECGQSVVNPAFTASYNAAPTSAVLTNDLNGESKNVISTPTSFFSSQTYVRSTPNQSVTWTLTTSNGTRTASSTWGQKNFWGISTSPASTEAFIEALASSQLTTARNAGFSVNATGANKIYFATPTRYGTPVFTVGGFVGGFILLSSTIAVTNAQGFAENYSLYESVNAGLGTTAVTVS